MKKIFKRFKSNPMFLVFVLILVFFTPSAIFSTGEAEKRAIVTAIGVDKLENEYELSLLTFIPTPNQTYLQTDSVISGKGATLAEAVHNTEMILGKKVGLSHAKTTVVNEKLLEGDIAKEIDYLGRVASLSENTVLVCTKDSAKEFLECAKNLEKDIGLELDRLIYYNSENIYVEDTTLEAFYQGYLSPTGSSIIGYFELEKSEQSPDQQGAGQDSSSGSGFGVTGGSGGGGGQDTPQQQGGAKKLNNKGQVALLKEGKKVALLGNEELIGINVINDKAIGATITIDNVDDDIYKDAKLTFTVQNKRVHKATRFENGHPIFSVNVVMGVELVESKERVGKIKNDSELELLPTDVEHKIEQVVRERFTKTLKILRENKTDVIGVRELFERQNRAQFQKFLKNLDDEEDYLNNINFELIVKARSE